MFLEVCALAELSIQRLIVIPGWLHCVAIQRVPIDYYHRRRLFYTHPVRTDVDSDEPFQGPGVLLLAGRTLHIFCSAQIQ